MATGSGRRSSRMTATQARAARRARRRARRRALRFGAFFVVGTVALLFILALFAPGLPISIGGGAPSGPGIKIQDQGRTHITPSDDHAPYNSSPPTSGPHYAQPLAPARWGVYDEPLPEEVLIHNLEHGGIGIQYNCPEGCQELVEQLRGMRDLASKIIMSPYPDMETTIALTAWTFIDAFDEFDEERIRAFISAHLNSQNAPEPQAP